MARRRLNSRSEQVEASCLCRSQSMRRVILIIALMAACQLRLADCEQQGGSSGSTRQEQSSSNQERIRNQEQFVAAAKQQHQQHSSQLSQKQNEIFPNKFAPNQQKQQHKNNTTLAHLQETFGQDSQLQLVSSSSPAPSTKFNQQQTISTASPSASSSSSSSTEVQNLTSLSASLDRAEASTKAASFAHLGPSSSGAPTELPLSATSGAEQEAARHKQLQQARSTLKAAGGGGARTNGDLIDPMATSQSVSFAEPLMGSSNRQEQQQQQQHQANAQQLQSQPQQLKPVVSGASNRWTHFGARLKPLTTSGADHHSADSRSLAAFAHNNSNKNGQQRAQTTTTSLGQALGGNQIGEVSASDDADDADDDQDSEALLYKMMQQQGFLTGSLWQQQEQPTRSASTGQASELLNQAAPVNELELDAASRAAANNAAGNSKRVIKLLKSYSHIHQVDDSDDQIRGSYTRVQQNRNNDNNNNNNNSWQRANQQQQVHNRNRPTSGGQQSAANRHSPQHIFVSSQPMARAYSNPNGRRQQPAQGDGGGGEMYNSQDGAPYNAYPAQPGEGGSAESGGEEANQQGPPEEDDFECPNNGIFADEASGCQSYHVCQSGAQVQQKFQCPLGTLFNNIILTCDFAHNVKCKAAASSDAPKVASSADEINNEPIHRNPQQQQQPQQVPRASNQLSEQSFVRPQQQQARWQQQASSGPRSLKIGQSQYNQHQAAAQQVNPQAQAVSAYPHPQPAAVAPSHGDDSSDDSDDEPLEPLKPATLPPPRQQLPYSAPPAPTQQQGSPNGAQFGGHQSAHRSPYGGQAQYQQQHAGAMNNYLPTANRGYDGDSAASPVFASRDEPRTTEATNNLVTNQVHQSQRQKQAQPQAHSSDAQSFNLVINHMTPARSHQTPAKISSNPATVQAIGDAYNLNGNKKLQPAQIAKQNYQMQPANQALLNEAYNKKLLQERNKQQFVVNSKQFSSANPQLFVKQHQQRINQAYDNQRQQQATQLKSVHVDAGASMSQQSQHQQQQQQQQQAAMRAAHVVDLTNDKRAAVSSDALNDGLLLIVRHSPQSAQMSAGSNIDNQQQQYYRQSATTSRSSGGNQQNAHGQAYAIDPAFVRPDSPIDAQLFPNVQRVLAASQPSVSHQAPPSVAAQHQHAASATTQYIQHVQPQAQQQQQISPPLNRISLPLQPMEPPKANVQYVNKNAHQNGNNSPESLQVVASSSALSSSQIAVSPAPANQTPAQANSQAQVSKPLAENKDKMNVQHGSKQQRHTTVTSVKKIKKVKANQSSAAKKQGQRNSLIAKSTSTTTTTTTAASASQTEPLKTMTHQKQQAEFKSTSSTVSPSAASLADQPVALIEEQQFLRTNSRFATTPK